MRGLVREFLIANERGRDEHNRDMRLAWHIAALTRTDRRKFPAHARQLYARRPGGQTLSEQRTVLQHMSVQYGIPLRVVPRRTVSTE